MARNISGLVSILLLALISMVLVSGCTTPGNPPVVTISPTTALPTTPVATPVVTTVRLPAQSCTIDDDCVPAECCHPTSCINKAEKSVCNVMCTMSCEGPIDCGAGHCGCVNGKCSVVASTVSK
ncbi:MAG TPA: hypothetical protein VMW77_00125 [Methanoregula sp.]|nr:hypothetical protein [Methanoregula sp.]